jgi:hypothetical protein
MAISGAFKYRYNATPRVSANQLAEYVSANPLRRKRIISEAKYPAALITTRYETARSAIRGHLIAGAGDNRILSSALDLKKRHGEKPNLSPWNKTNYKICSEAIRAFEDSESSLKFGKVNFRACDLSKNKLQIGAVTVSVALDAMTEMSHSSGRKFVGGIILVLNKPTGKKGKNNMPDRCAATALLAQEIVEIQLLDGEICDPKMCMAIDVYGGVGYQSKSQHKQLSQNLEMACEEISTRWPTIAPPPKYDGPPVS